LLIERLRDIEDDLAWEKPFAASQDWLARRAEEVLKDWHEGRTDELDPDTL
jgi:hypothetical protein